MAVVFNAIVQMTQTVARGDAFPKGSFLFFFSTGEFEELKDTVTCLCKGDYFTALKGKTSQHLLHLAAASTGEILVIYHQNNFVGSLCFIVLLIFSP